MELLQARSGRPGCPVCDGEGELVVSQDELGVSDFMGHNVEPCPICFDEEIEDYLRNQ